MVESSGRVAVVTGVSRRQGIGFAIARRLLAEGVSVLIHSWAAHRHRTCGGPVGAVDVLIANHARSALARLDDVTSTELDLAWAVNARAAVLLTQAFAERHDDSRPDGRVVLFTSGQHLGPMVDELPYAISKGAVHQMTASLADALADRAFTLNAINPDPVDTGWPSDALRERLRRAFPAQRWGQPDDIAKIVSWLVSAESRWLTGQVINAEGGFRR